MVAPLFVFGIARSGTNLVARMLDAHPAIAVALDPLMPLFRSWRNLAMTAAAAQGGPGFDPSAPFQDYYFTRDGWSALDLMLVTELGFELPPGVIESLREAVRDRAALESPSLATRFADWGGSRIDRLFAAALDIVRAEARERGKPNVQLVGIKELWTLEFALALSRAFPEARFVLIHRDPRAIVASLTQMGNSDQTQAAHSISFMRHWRKQVAVASNLAGRHDFGPRFLQVRYEDLVADPESGARRLAGFLGVPYAESMLSPGGAEWVGNSSFGPRGAMIDAKGLGRWRAHLSTAVVATTEFHCGAEMRMLGYATPESLPTLGPEIYAAVDAAHRNPGKWRSDSGDPASDLAWEVTRRHLLEAATSGWPTDLVRRCFLFTEMRELLLQQHRGP